MRASSYAQALHGALLAHPNDETKVLSQFVATVGANGHQHLFPRIIKHFGRIVGKAEQETTIEVVSAKPLSEQDTIAILKKEPFKHSLGTHHKRVVRKVDETLVSGVVVRAGTTQIDASAKRVLLEIYQNFTATL